MNDMKSQTGQRGGGNANCTFEITVRFTQNATWQGQIQWFESKKKQNFRSALEMLKLMDEALAGTAKDEHQIGWGNENEK